MHMDISVIAGLLVLLLLGIVLFARAYTGGMRFGDRLESRRAAQREMRADSTARGYTAPPFPRDDSSRR